MFCGSVLTSYILEDLNRNWPLVSDVIFILPIQPSLSLPESEASTPAGGCEASINQVYGLHHLKRTAHEAIVASKLSVSTIHTSARSHLVFPT